MEQLTMSGRQELLRRYFELVQRINDAGVDQVDEAAREEMLEAEHLYEQQLPRVPLSRCPLTGEVILHSFDAYGLDGLWWNYEAPARPLLERFVTCIAVTGAVRLAPEVENFPFLCKPGPGAPYVHPELLRRQGVYGVVHSLPVGPHTAYAILYFSAEPVSGISMPNAWGTDTYWDAHDGNPGWYSTPDAPEAWHFDLAPWIERGKLFWIAPGDATMTLRAEVAGCPFVGLPGVHQPQRITGGKVHLTPVVEATRVTERIPGKPMAGDFIFLELKPELRDELKLPTEPIPVRRDRQHLVFPDTGHVNLPAMIEEIRAFIAQNPDLQSVYIPLLAVLAYLAGMDAAARGEHEQALHIYEMGLAAEPGSVSLRSHYALSLHCLGRHAESRRELERVVADTPQGTVLPLVWMMLVRSYADEGEYAKADALLAELVAVDSAANTFREFLAVKLQEAEAQKKAAETETRRHTASVDARPDTKPSQPWYYVVAGKSVGPVTVGELQGLLARGELSADTLVWNPGMPDWCCARNVGQESPPKLPPDLPVKPLQGARCPKCDLEVTPDMRFCTKCGAALTTG